MTKKVFELREEQLEERAVMYHGTHQKFDTFDDSKPKRGTFGVGHYLTNAEDLAKEYAGDNKPMKVKVHLKKPYEVDLDKGFEHSMKRSRIFREKDAVEQLKAKGHDGVLIKQGNYREVVAFHGASLKTIKEMAPPHVERDEIVRRLIKHKIPIKRRESSKISDSEYLHVDVGDEHDEYGDKIGDRLIKVRISDHRATRHAIQKHGAAHVEIGPHAHSVDRGMKEILRHAGIHEAATGDCFKTAHRHCMSKGGEVVHAEVTNGNKRFHHAWVERDGKVHDHSNGNQIEMDKESYYDKAGVHRETIKRYSQSQARVKGIKSRHFGPWELNEETLEDATAHRNTLLNPLKVHYDDGRVLFAFAENNITEGTEDHPYTYHADESRFGVLAKHKGKNVGQLTLQKEDGKTTAFEMAVHPSHRRKGIMTRMHQEAEKHFGDIHPSKTLSDDGHAFWAKYRPEAVKDDLRTHRQKLMGKDVETHYGKGKITSIGSRAAIATLDSGKTAPAKKDHIQRLINEETEAEHPVTHGLNFRHDKNVRGGFHVMRLGSSKDVRGKNAANDKGLANYLIDQDDDERPSNGAATHVHVFHVSGHDQDAHDYKQSSKAARDDSDRIGVHHKSWGNAWYSIGHKAKAQIKSATGNRGWFDPNRPEITEAIIDTELPKHPKSIASQKYKVKKAPNERRPLPARPKVSSAVPPQVNYAQLSNHSLAARSYWGDKLAAAELERRNRQMEKEPENALEPKTSDSYDPYVHGVDQRFPKGVFKNQIGNVVGKKRIVDVESLKLTPEIYEKNVRLVKDYPNMEKGSEALKTDELAEKFIQHAEDNLLWLHDNVDKSIRTKTKRWYDGANKLARQWSDKYRVPMASVAATLAALSPQMDWYRNVALAGRVLDYVKGDKGIYDKHKYDDAMDQAFLDRPAFHKPEYDDLRKMMKGKSMADIDAIPDMTQEAKAGAKAMWIHLYDGAYADQSYHLINPEGEFLDKATKGKKKELAQATFMTLGTVANAIMAIEANGDIGKISPSLGDKHKVRNFFNNIFNPNSPDGDVTIDTHAVAAALLRPLSQSSIEVAHNFDSSLGKGAVNAAGSAKTGVGGTYPLYAEALRRAAKKRGILPREMQSITWEAIRGLFPREWKSRHGDEVENIWQQYKEGMIDIRSVRKAILQARGGKIDDPTWLTGQAEEDESSNRVNEASGDSDHAPVLSGPELRRAATTGTQLRARIGNTRGIEESTAKERLNLIKVVNKRKQK